MQCRGVEPLRLQRARDQAQRATLLRQARARQAFAELGMVARHLQLQHLCRGPRRRRTPSPQRAARVNVALAQAALDRLVDVIGDEETVAAIQTEGLAVERAVPAAV